MLVAVETVDGDGQVPAALGVHLGHGVQHPLVARCGDVHAAGLAQEVHVKGGHGQGILRVCRRHHADGQLLIVEALAGTHLHLQHRLCARHDGDGHAAGGQRLSVDADLGAVRIQLVGSEELQDGQAVGGLGLLALVGDEDHEVGRVVDRHTAHALLIEADLRVADFQRAGVEHLAGVIELRLALVLPRIGGRTATGAEYESARTLDLVFLQRLLHVILHVLGQRVIVEVREYISNSRELVVLVDRYFRAIDIHVQMAARVGGDGEALRAVVCFRLRVCTHRIEQCHGNKRPLEQVAGEIHFRLGAPVHIDVRAVSGRSCPGFHLLQRKGNTGCQRNTQ